MFKCYRQLEHSDCGLSCIRMVAKHHGIDVSLTHLKNISDLNKLGMSIKDIVSVSNDVGLDAVAIKIGTDFFENMPLPAILYWEQKHFVVLYKYSKRRRRYFIADPAQGKISYSEEDFKRLWIPNSETSGLAILMEPNPDFKIGEIEKDKTLKDFFKYIFGFVGTNRMRFIWAILISLLIMGSDFMVPILLRKTIDEGIGLKDIGMITALLCGQFAIALGGIVATNVMGLLLSKIGLRINLEMVLNYLNRLAKFPLSFFDKKVSSDFVQKINDQSRIKDFLVSFPNQIVISVLTFVVFSTLLFTYSRLIFVFFLTMSIIEIFWNFLFLNKKKSLDYFNFKNSSENTNHAFELTNGMADLKVNNAEQTRIANWKSTMDELYKTSMKLNWLGSLENGGRSILSRIKDLSVTGISAYMVVTGDMTFGVMMTLGYITGRLSSPFSTISTSVSSLQQAWLSYQRVEDVINDKSEARGSAKFSSPTMSFNGVWFKYPGSASPYVIKDFNLEVESGKVTALVGESGCGKSTLIKLMLGFYIPQKGELRLSGNKIQDLDCSDWMSHCGVVMQQARIFSGSILENIALSDENPNVEKAMSVLRMVGLDEFVSTLPMGINTIIGSTGIEMSGGQRQRLMIARAIYKNPDILFLDEATSSLDANNERSIVEKIRSFGYGKTIVIAAHRLSTVQNADKIAFIKNGEIIESGNHQELIAQKGEYWHLVKNQLQLSII